MSLNLVDENDESYSPMHKHSLQEIHDFINSQKVLKLNKLMISGLVDIPDEERRVAFRYKIESIAEDALKITMGFMSLEGKIKGVGQTITITFQC